MMNPDQFWTSQDGQILAIRNKDERTVTSTLAFWPRHPAEFDFLKAHLAELKFSERSSLARIGIEMLLQGPPAVDGHRLTMEADAFIYDPSFPERPVLEEAPPPRHAGRPAFLRPGGGQALDRGDLDGDQGRTTSSCPTRSASTASAASSSPPTR